MGDENSSNLNAGLIVWSMITFILTVIINGLNGAGAATGGLFVATVGEISDK